MKVFRRMTSTGGASLKELCERTAPATATRSSSSRSLEPTTPRTPRTPRTPGGSRSTVKSSLTRQGSQTKVEIVVNSSPSNTNAANAAPLADELLERPSLGRAAALGARPGHFNRTNSKKDAGKSASVTIILPGEEPESPQIVDRGRPILKRASSSKYNKTEAQEGPQDAFAAAAKAEATQRENDLEDRLRKVEAMLATATAANNTQRAEAEASA